MLGNAKHLQQLYSQITNTHPIGYKLIQLIIPILPITLFTLRAIAKEPPLDNLLISTAVAQKSIVGARPILKDTPADNRLARRHGMAESNDLLEPTQPLHQFDCADRSQGLESCYPSPQSPEFSSQLSTANGRQRVTFWNSVRSLLSSNFQFRPQVITPGRARLMTKELEGLIGRFETTLLTAEAYQSDVGVSTVEVIQQMLDRPTVTSKQNLKQSAQYKSQYRDAYRALYKARQGLKRFHSLIDQRYYGMAQTEWSAAKQTLWDHYPRDRPVAQSEVRGIWLDRGTIVKAKSQADLVPIFDRMATAGINTIFFETVNSGYTIYPSQIAPQQNPLVKGWDPLKAAIELAHERGMELHAWVWTFAAVNQRHNEILGLPRNYLGPVLAKHPDWAATDQEGSRFHYSSGKVFFDPANPEVQSYLSSLFAEIATEYEVDGIHLDYIRYPFQSLNGKITYGYGRAARDKFSEETGFDPINLYPSNPLWSEWTKFRIRQVDNFVSSIADNLQQIRPDLTLSTAVFPMPKRERLFKIQQHWETWVAKEWIDILIPMTYAEDADRLYTLANPLLDEFERGKALLLPGIRLLNISDIAALDQMQLLRGMSTEGYALFAAENLNSDLIDIFNSTQGAMTDNSKSSLPHREPFQVTLDRYQSLQKEWNFFLINNQREFEVAVLEEWGQKADRLTEDLQKLVAEPSNKNFFSTQVALNSLRRQFPRWMNQTKGVDVYQAKVWQNRLDTLDRLLSYGEKKTLNPSQTTIVR